MSRTGSKQRAYGEPATTTLDEDAAGMTEVLELADRMTAWGVLRHADFSGFEIQPLIDEATRRLATVVPFRDDADLGAIAHLLGPDDQPSAEPSNPAPPV